MSSVNEFRRDIITMDNCIQIVLNGIEPLRRIPVDWRHEPPYERIELWGLARIFYMCGKKWGKGEHCESVLCTLEEKIYQCSLEVQIICLPILEVVDHRVWELLAQYFPFMQQAQYFPFRMIWPIMREMNELDQILSNGPLETYPSSQMEMEDLLFIIDSLLSFDFHSIYATGDLKESIRFLKNFILFVAFRGLEPMKLGDLTTHVRDVVVDVVCFIFRTLNRPHDESSSWSNLYKLIDRVEPVESHVCEIYVKILQEASEFSNSSNDPAPGCQALLLADFVDSLIFLLSQLFFRCTGQMYIFDHQVYKLYNGLSFLRTTLSEQHDKGDELYEKLRDMIQVLICKAGVIVCYLFHGEKERSLGAKLELLFSDFMEKFKLVKSEEKVIPRSLQASHFPQTNLLGFIDSILEKINSVDQHEADSVVASFKNQLQIILSDLAYLRSFLANVMGQHDQDGKLSLWSRVADVAYETEFVFDSLVTGGTLQSFIMPLNTIIKEIELVKIEAQGSSHSTRKITNVHSIPNNEIKKPLAGNIPKFDELVVGLDDESDEITYKLKRDLKRLDVVSIVGMAGLGKTTIAKKVYSDLSITFHFHVRIWFNVSQSWNKKSLLLEILSSLDLIYATYQEISEDDLANILRKYLKGKKYLVILDDVWDIDVWDKLKISFPDDSMGSRILITSRYENVALQIRPDHEPHHLRFLTNAESWELFQMKMCFEDSCPTELLARGKKMATHCKGLPLMIIVVAGSLSSMKPDTWEEIEGSLKRVILPTTNECKEILELSYRHLPDYLKPCFLYFGAYKEHKKVMVHEFLRLWIAEGFVKKSEKECVEDVAEGYMMDLIQRNLVMVIEKGSKGRVKSCALHDLLLDFCMAKGKQENFLHRFDRDGLGTSTQSRKLYRLHVSPGRVEDFEESGQFFPYLRTLLFNDDCQIGHGTQWFGIMYNICQSKLLRVLCLNRIFEFRFFPSAVQLLGHLRNLTLAFDRSIRMPSLSIPSSIIRLSNLETFTVLGGVDIFLPYAVWNMEKLRHMIAPLGAFVWELPTENPEHLLHLKSLQTLSSILYYHDQTLKEVTRNFPNLRRLRCILSLVEEEYHALKIFPLDFLSQLESLHITRKRQDFCVYHFQFPENLKKLTLSNLGLAWSEISSIAGLPNLEVLKLLESSFKGKTWYVEEDTFPKLKFLKLEELDVVSWTTESENIFPRLEKLVLKRCWSLEELPCCLASTLVMMEVIYCGRAGNSIKQIEKLKTCFGYEEMKILVHPAHSEESSPSQSNSETDHASYSEESLDGETTQSSRDRTE
ncbi:OLC1v1005939C2 [Oldenlandia corymbosa var. corymbosa]|uniref:OLC1v1005939C2 n=2 Tax=Oldenlandia corymbosa var. corymbosa TaxID=529605 RepID=A0AAV1DG94_OLDCO|nr:OLC1v1005939C2 [Oldenlandia corymbosa var. corymbosa]